MKRVLLTLLASAAVAGLFLWLSVRSGKHGIEACMLFEGRRACGRAWAPTPDEARRAAIDNACGPLTGSMTQRMACRRLDPVTVTALGPLSGAR